MEQQFSDYYQGLTQLSNYLGEGIERRWSHELRKQILLLLHKLKNSSRKQADTEIESELISIEVTLGYGSGSSKEPEISQIEDHQLRLLELVESKSNAKFIVEEDSTDENGEVEESVDLLDFVADESSTDLQLVTSNIQLILCNCPGRDAARELAYGLVNARLAACVNIIANIGAIYWWQGEIKDTAECQLQIKTSHQSLDDVIQFIKHKHPNDVPEILAITVDKGNNDYFDWVKQETYDRE